MLLHKKFHDVDTKICQCIQWGTPDLGHICLLGQLKELTFKTFVSPSKNRAKNKGKKKEWQLQSVFRYSQTHQVKSLK